MEAHKDPVRRWVEMFNTHDLADVGRSPRSTISSTRSRHSVERRQGDR
jgi:hypothetical protein